MQTAADVMSRPVITIDLLTPVAEIARLMSAHHIGGLPVVGDYLEVLGIVTVNDLIGHAQVAGERRQSWWHDFIANSSALAEDYAKRHGRLAQDLMSREVITVERTTPVTEVAQTIERHRVGRAPVVRNGILVGIVSRSDLIKSLAAGNDLSPVDHEDRELRERLIDELESHSWGRFLGRNIIVQDGVIHLFGLVQSDEERRAVRIAAENLPGARRVVNHLSLIRMDGYGL